MITANTGGMAEYVHHEVNGLLFEHRSFAALAEQMQRFVDAPELAAKLGSRGYVFSQDGDIPDIYTHVQDIEALYKRLLRRRDRTKLVHAEAPWRITFDTNPDRDSA
ncbi:glycosyltransferase [Quatrionicoccus australiensis]|uniref:glycosyltransferase n=1 Tax=Quatrionicoccus australiensis TaxID=138118 RepID=UPI00384D2EA8